MEWSGQQDSDNFWDLVNASVASSKETYKTDSLTQLNFIRSFPGIVR
jgi:hypothetical protein